MRHFVLYIVLLAVCITPNYTSAFFDRPLFRGTSGEDVSLLQTILRDHGFYNYPTITGNFGIVTERALQAFQSDQNIVNSGTPETTGYGRLGPVTRNALNIIYTNSKIGTSLSVILSKAVYRLQELLLEAGYTDVVPNGILDSQTLSAITKIQYDIGKASPVSTSRRSGGGGSSSPAPDLGPAKPTQLSINPDDAAIELVWIDPPSLDLAYVTIYRGATSGSLMLLATTSPSVESYTDTNLVNGTEYFYALSATYLDGSESDRTNVLSGSPAFDAVSFFNNRTFEVDFDDNAYYWGISAKAASDLTVTANGYTLADVSWRGATSTTYLIEWTPDPSTTTAQTKFALYDTVGTERVEFELTSTGARLYNNPPGATYNYNENSHVKLGRNRLAITLTNGSKPEAVRNGGSFSESSFAGGSIGLTNSINMISIGYRGRFSDQKFVGTLHRIIAIDRAYSLEELEEIVAHGGQPRYHLIGDSFLNTDYLQNAIRINLAADWRISTQDGVGGSSLVEQAARFALTPKYWDSTLIIVDGGLSDEASDAVSAIGDMVSRLSHDRWLYVEPGYGTGQIAGSPNRASQDATVAAIQAAFPNNFLPTLSEIQALNDGGAEDLEDVNVSDIWPRSLRSDALHPGTALNTAGYSGISALAEIVSNELTNRGW